MRFIITLIFFLSLYQKGLAQIYTFNRFGEKEGLTHLQVNCINQQANGNMFFGTDDGLFEYDGFEFVQFDTSNFLSENYIKCLTIGKDSSVWCGHLQNGLSAFKNKQIAYRKSKLFSGLRISNIIWENKSLAWILTQGDGIVSLNNGKVKKYDKLPEASFNSGLLKSNDLLLGHSNGLVVYRKNNLSLSDSYSVDSLDGVQINELIESGDKVFVATEGKGIYGLKLLKGRWEVFLHIQDKLQSKQNNIKCIYFDKQDNLWVSIYGEGLRVLTFSNKQFVDYDVQIVNEKNGLSEKYINSIFQDNQNNLWLATNGEGLLELTNENFTFYSSAFEGRIGNISSITINKKNEIYFSNSLDGFKLNIQNSVSDRIERTKAKARILFSSFDGNVWYANLDRGCGYINPKGNVTEVNLPNGQPIPYVTCFASDGNRLIYIGTNEGLVVYDVKTAEVKYLTSNEGLVHNVIKTLCFASDGKLWFGCEGAAPFNYYKGEFTLYKDIHGLKSFHVNAICEDIKHNIWIATNGDGIFCFDGKMFKHYTMKNGLNSNFCYGVVSDNKSNVWVSHSKGFSLKCESWNDFKYYYPFSFDEDVVSNANLMVRDIKGAIWMGTNKGLLRHGVQTSELLNVNPILNITSVEIDGKVIDNSKSIDLEYGSYSFKVSYSSPEFNAPTQIMYKYILQGYDKSEYIVDYKVRSAFYPKLEDGDYVFTIMAKSKDGFWSKIAGIVNIHIEKPFWKKWWPYALLFIVLIFSVLTYVNWRTKQLKLESARLEMIVEERTVELNQKNLDLERASIELERKNKDVTDSINYAKRIQQAILPKKIYKEIKHDDLFIFNQPREIVSGDFYWYTQQGNYFFIACVDCTGHGVPGAFMSMIGTTLLNKIVIDQKIQDTAKILKAMDESIVDSLNQADGQNQDGMDLSLLKIDLKNLEVQFSSAKRPIFLYRKSELIEFKGDSSSIGGAADDSSKIFTSNTIAVERNDMFYLFTDGFTDQFGGPNNRRFLTKNLKTLLESVCNLPVSEQNQKISTTFAEWKKSSKQTDDVLLIGIKI